MLRKKSLLALLLSLCMVVRVYCTAGENRYEYCTGLCEVEECNSGKSCGGCSVAKEDKEKTIP